MRTLSLAILKPALALVVVCLAALDQVAGVPQSLWVLAAGLAVFVIAVWQVRAWRTRRALLHFRPCRAGDLALGDLVNRGFSSEPGDPEPQTVEKVARLLKSRRLVVLVGGSGSGHAQVALDALRKADLTGYRVVRPRGEREAGQTSLAVLLGSGNLPPRRYALWLGDLGLRLQAGLDPRLIERWLASGPGRVALGTLTREMDDLVRDTRASAAYALQRAAFVNVEPRVGEPAQAPIQRYRYLQEHAPGVAALVRLVATCRLLGIPPQQDAFYADLAARSTTPAEGTGPPSLALDGPAAPLRRDSGGCLRADASILALIDRELGLRLEPTLFRVLQNELGPAELVKMAQYLTLRAHFDQARVALDRADRLAPSDRAVADAQLWLSEIEDGMRRGGPTGATLGRRGGFDYDEPPGPGQEEASRALPPKGDGVFDPTLPEPEAEGAQQRFYRRTNLRAAIRVGVLMLLDLVAVSSAAAAALVVRGMARDRVPTLGDDRLWKVALSASVVFWVIASSLGLYKASAPRARVQALIAATAIVTVLTAAAFFIAEVDLGTAVALPVMFGVSFVLSVAFRYLYDVRSRRWVLGHHLAPRVLLLGSLAEARRYAENMSSTGGRPVQPVAFLTPSGDAQDPFCVGSYKDLEACLHDLYISDVAIVDHALGTSDKANLTSRAQGFGCDVRFVAQDTEILLGAVGRVSDLGFVHVPRSLISPERLELKRMVDWLLVMATMPFWLTCFAAYTGYSAIWRRGQPVLVSCPRIGLGQVPFDMFRLRTRTVHPDGARGARPTGRVESLLEITGLDELPQVVNVLRGDMSLVGPRPLATREAARLLRDQKRTLSARPGITGRWQVTWPVGASEGDMRTVDADYLRRWRVSLDFEILLLTVQAVVIRRRRYLGDTEIARRRGDSPTDLLFPETS